MAGTPLMTSGGSFPGGQGTGTGPLPREGQAPSQRFDVLRPSQAEIEAKYRRIYGIPEGSYNVMGRHMTPEQAQAFFQRTVQEGRPLRPVTKPASFPAQQWQRGSQQTSDDHLYRGDTSQIFQEPTAGDAYLEQKRRQEEQQRALDEENRIRDEIKKTEAEIAALTLELSKPAAVVATLPAEDDKPSQVIPIYQQQSLPEPVGQVFTPVSAAATVSPQPVAPAAAAEVSASVVSAPLEEKKLPWWLWVSGALVLFG
jgi:hypothetical protein